MENLQTSAHGPVAVLTLRNPPVNGLSWSLRRSLMDALDAARKDPGVRAVVLYGGESAFSGGADVREFGTPKPGMDPNLPTVIQALDDFPKPTVAAIAGHCLGGGLELALGCHWRVACADASLGLPEIKLGLLPGAGGTQRLPRAIGIEASLALILGGDPRRAADFAGTPLIDALVGPGGQGDLLEAALAFAGRAAEQGWALRRLRDRKVDAGEAQLQALEIARQRARAAVPALPAPLRCVEALAASISQPFDEGLQTERKAFFELMNTPESRGLRHAFAAERAAGKVEGLRPEVQPRRIATVGIVGAGTMGSGIAMAFANADIPVVLVEANQAALDRGVATIGRNYEATLAKGRITPEQCARRKSLIRPTLDFEELGGADLVIEAVFEEMEVKQPIFERLDGIARPGAILASNTSALDLDRIAACTRRPQDVIGLHFFSPANVMRLLEVVRGARTAPEVLATAMQVSKRIGKVAVVSGVCDGFIGNRMLARYVAAAMGLIDLGASPQQIDRALEGFGMAMGLFRVGDLAGLDIGWAARKRRGREHPEQDFSSAADRICEAGRFGQKTGAGWYRYEAGSRDALPDPEVERILARWREERGCRVRAVGDEEIVQRCMFALVNEGARILQDRIAQRASDIDVVYLSGYGFPRYRGGPMRYADEIGLPLVARTLRGFAAQAPGDQAAWEPAPLLERLAQEGGSFTG
jgi:3-hydroxyacyl-CoA dehydrogenase